MKQHREKTTLNKLNIYSNNLVSSCKEIVDGN